MKVNIHATFVIITSKLSSWEGDTVGRQGDNGPICLSAGLSGCLQFDGGKTKWKNCKSGGEQRSSGDKRGHLP